MSCVADQHIRRLHLRRQFTSVFERLRLIVVCHALRNTLADNHSTTVKLSYDNSLPVYTAMVDMSATPTRRPWNITATNHRLADNFLPDWKHFLYDNSSPVTCFGTRRQALIRRTWNVISTTYRL